MTVAAFCRRLLRLLRLHSETTESRGLQRATPPNLHGIADDRRRTRPVQVDLLTVPRKRNGQFAPSAGSVAVRLSEWKEDTLRDLQHALRRFVRHRRFSLAVIAVLALGISATTAMFSAVDAAMLRPLPFPRSAQLVVLDDIGIPIEFGRGQPNRTAQGNHSVMISDVAEMRDVFSHVAAYATGGLNLANPYHPARVRAALVSADFFATLGVSTSIGRTFTASECVPYGPHVVVLSFHLWQQLFAGRNVLGTSVSLGDASYTVVGIMPRNFAFPEASEVWLPMSMPNTSTTYEIFSNVFGAPVIARLAQGITLRVASERLLARWDQVAAAETPASGALGSAHRRAIELRKVGALRPLQFELVGNQRTALVVLLGSTLLLLLIACANVTNLQLSQRAERRPEMAMRLALGASHARITRQLLTENVVLSAAGAALGVALAPVFLGAVRVLMPATLAGVAEAELDLRVLAFAAVLALTTAVAFGAWPAMGTRGHIPQASMASGSRGITSRRVTLGYRMLAGIELSLTSVLLIGAGLMLRSFQRVMSLETGMNTAHVGTFELVLPRTAGDRSHRLQTIDEIVARIAETPGVSAVGVVNELPMRVAPRSAVYIAAQGAPNPKGGNTAVRQLLADSGYFAALKIPLLAGRLFTTADDSLAPRVALINETMAQDFWGTSNPVGRSFTAIGPMPIAVVGVVADVRESLRGSPAKIFPQMYLPIAVQTPENLAIVARATLPPSALLSLMTNAVRAVDPSQAVYNARTMDMVVSESIAPRRASTLLVSAFAAIALLLAAIGVYAVVAHGVARRTRELGIRAALGASGANLVSLVAYDMIWITGCGISIGLAGAWVLAHLLEGMLYNVSAHDLTTFAVVPFVLAIPSAVAALTPAFRVLRLDPADVLRAE